MQQLRDAPLEVARSLRTLRRAVDQIERRTGETDLLTGKFAEKDHKHINIGEGPWQWDYLIDYRYTGVDGEEFITLHGFTFKIYRSLEASVADSNVVRQAVGQKTTFFIIEGDYTLSSTVTFIVPQDGTYHVWGSGPYASILFFTGDNIPMIKLQTSVDNPSVILQHLGLKSNGNDTGSTLVLQEDGVYLRVIDCQIRASLSGIGIEINTDSRGADIIDCYFITGMTSIRIKSDSGVNKSSLYIRGNLFYSMDTAIDLDQAEFISIVSNYFTSVDTGIYIRGTSGSGAIVSSCIISENFFQFGISSIRIDSVLNSHSAIIIMGNHFNRIDYGIRFESSGGELCAFGVVICSNSFSAGNIASFAIYCNSVLAVNNSIASGNLFYDFTSGNEIVNWDGSGNEAFHNIAMASISVGTKYPLADIGNPVGHGVAGSGLSLSSSGEYVLSPSKVWADAINTN